ncbi:MAG: hypothetical protein ACRC0Y_04065 [Fusobacteriaceae bacterium]
MSIVNFKKLKEVSLKSKETHLIDLGKYIDKKLEGVIIPIRVKSIEECIDLKNEFKLKKEKLTIKYKPFTRMTKDFKQMYMESDEYKRGQTENTYFQILEVSKDESTIEKKKYRQRLFNILVHFDMDYLTEEGKNLWEDAGLNKHNYDGLVDIFSDIIKYEIHLDKLDLVIDKIKSGIIDEETLTQSIAMMDLRNYLDTNYDNEEDKVQAFKDLVEASVKANEAKEEKENLGEEITELEIVE